MFNFKRKKAEIEEPRTGLRVLVCTAEVQISRLIQVNLERQGYRVDRCSTYAAGIELFQAASQDVDPHRMAVLEYFDEGRRLPKWIRENDETRDLPVIMVGKPNDDDPPSMSGGPTFPFNPPAVLAGLRMPHSGDGLYGEAV